MFRSVKKQELVLAIYKNWIEFIYFFLVSFLCLKFSLNETTISTFKNAPFRSMLPLWVMCLWVLKNSVTRLDDFLSIGPGIVQLVVIISIILKKMKRPEETVSFWVAFAWTFLLVSFKLWFVVSILRFQKLLGVEILDKLWTNQASKCIFLAFFGFVTYLDTL
jgi:hypothetical protein